LEKSPPSGSQKKGISWVVMSDWGMGKGRGRQQVWVGYRVDACGLGLWVGSGVGACVCWFGCGSVG
jgi:hypothetical protein